MRIYGQDNAGVMQGNRNLVPTTPGDKIGDEAGTDCFRIVSWRVHSDPQVPHIGGATHLQ